MATAPQLRDTVDFLSLLSESSRRRVTAGAKRQTFSAGLVTHHAGDPPPRVYLIEHGLMRVFWSDPDGRQATVAYIGTRQLIGVMQVLGDMWHGGSAQAVVESTVLRLDAAAVRRAAAEELDVCSALALHLASVLNSAFRTIAVRSLGSVAQRLAYDLLDRACIRQLQSGRLEASITHAELADSIGSSREVVSRALAEYRAAGIIQTSPRCIKVVKPLMLAQAVRQYLV